MPQDQNSNTAVAYRHVDTASAAGFVDKMSDLADHPDVVALRNQQAKDGTAETPDGQAAMRELYEKLAGQD